MSRASYSWSELGPNTWTYTSGWNPGVGRITFVAVHPANESIIYVSSPGGGIWKSTNSCATWAATGSGPSGAKKVLIHPTNSSIIFATSSNGIIDWR